MEDQPNICFETITEGLKGGKMRCRYIDYRSQIDQASALLLLLVSWGAEWIIRLSKPSLLRYASELLVEKRIASGLLWTESLTCRVDKLTWSSMVSWNT